MSLFSEESDLTKIKIDISSNIFTHLDKTYRLQFIKKLYNRNYILIKLFKLYILYKCVNILDEISDKYIFVKDIVCKIIYRPIESININNNYEKSFYNEINYNFFLEKNMPNFRCNILYYYIKNANSINCIEYGMFFDYLGETLEKFNISSLDISTKIKLIIDLLQQCIELNNLSLYHSDIKPDNICIQCLDQNTSEYQLSLIDYGILYGKKEYNNVFEYNSTITSGSPEYYNINKLMENNSILFRKDLFDKSQHFAVAGIIFGIIIDNPYLYFNELYKNIKNNIKYSKINFDECDILIRFSPFKDPILLDGIKQFILDKLNKLNKINGFCIKEDYDFVKDIIMNMLQIKHNERLSFDEIKLFFENKLIELDK